MTNYSILVVDNQKFICNLMINTITKVYDNISVKCIGNINDSFDEVKSKKYDLIFMDIDLEKGSEVCIKVLEKINELRPDQNIYMMTGYVLDNNLKNIINKYALGILRKPFRLADITKVIEETIDVKK